MTRHEPESSQSPQEEMDVDLPEGVERVIIARYFVGEEEFEDARSAIEYKELIDEVEAVNSILKRAVDPNGGFKRGVGYIQHPEEALTYFREQIASLLDKHDHVGHANFFRREHRLFKTHDNVHPVLVELCDRSYLIDSQGREWGCEAALHPKYTGDRIEVLWENIY